MFVQYGRGLLSGPHPQPRLVSPRTRPRSTERSVNRPQSRTVNNIDYLGVGPEGRNVGMNHSLDRCSDQPGVQSLLGIHLLHRFHGLEFGQLRLRGSDGSVPLRDEGFKRGLLLYGLSVDGG